jgi:rubrerythrin
MSQCTHPTLELLPEPKKTVRCRRCHLTIARDELPEGYCPECFENSGTKRYEFDDVVVSGKTPTRYRCEECGVVFETR